MSPPRVTRVQVRSPSAVEAGIKAEQRLARWAAFRGSQPTFHRGEAIEIRSGRRLAERLSSDSGWQPIEDI